MIDDWGKVGWSVQLDSVQRPLVGIDDSFNTSTEWVVRTTILTEENKNI